MVSRAAPVAEQVDAILNNLVFKASLVSGTTASANIAISGIETGDKLVTVVGFDPDNGTAANQVQNFSGEASITSNATSSSPQATPQASTCWCCGWTSRIRG